jgi:uncharacterized protein (DUF302 family)
MKHPLLATSTTLSVHEAADKLASLLKERNIQLFARIDHGEAAKVSGLQLGEEQVLIFGDPKVGTFLMQECPAVGFELPLRIVFWEEAGTKIGYRDPKELLEQYQLDEHREVVLKMSSLMAMLVAELVKS